MRTSRLPSSPVSIALAVTPAFLSEASTRCRSAASIAAPRLAVICTEGSCGYRLGNAYSVLSSTTNRMTTYFQRAYSSIDNSSSVARLRRKRSGEISPQCPDCAVARPVRAAASGSGGLERALGQHVADRAFLHAHAHVVGDLDGDEVVADVGDRAGDAAVGDDFVALGQLFQH